jgi:hypothetical protein
VVSLSIVVAQLAIWNGTRVDGSGYSLHTGNTLVSFQNEKTITQPIFVPNLD